MLNDMGPAYAGHRPEAESASKPTTRRSRHLARIGNRQGEALTLEDIGCLYRDLSQHQTALDYYNQALPIWREVGNRSGEALALSDIGRAYADLGQPQRALDYASQALPIFRDTGSRRGEAMTLNNMGRDHSELGEAQAGSWTSIFRRSPSGAEIKDQRNEARLPDDHRLGLLANETAGNLAGKRHCCGLALRKSSGDPQIEGGVENSMMLGFRKQHHPEEAIFFGLDAVNDYEQIRRNITGPRQGTASRLCAIARRRSTACWPNCSSSLAVSARPNKFSICSRSKN